MLLFGGAVDQATGASGSGAAGAGGSGGAASGSGSGALSAEAIGALIIKPEYRDLLEQRRAGLLALAATYVRQTSQIHYFFLVLASSGWLVG